MRLSPVVDVVDTNVIHDLAHEGRGGRPCGREGRERFVLHDQRLGQLAADLDIGLSAT